MLVLWQRLNFFNRLMCRVNITKVTSLICLWNQSMPFIHKIKAKLLGNVTNIILSYLCSQFTQSQSSSFITFNIFANVNNTILCLLFLFASDKNCCFMIQWQIYGKWFSKKNDGVLVQWQLDGKWFSEKLIKSLY